MRITKETRSDIITHAVASKFTAREKALEDSRTQLADALYHQEFGLVEPAARALPAGWVEHCSEICCDAPGWVWSRYMAKQEGPCRNLRMSVDRPMPNGGLRTIKVEKGDKLFKHSQDIVKEYLAIAKEKEALRDALNRLLLSVTTLKQLRATWPEGEPFFPRELKYSTALVPVTLTRDINQMLGLAPRSPAKKVVEAAMKK